MATISVVQVLHQLGDRRIIFQEHKSNKGRRLITLSPSAVLALKTHKKLQELEKTLIGGSLQQDDMVFCHLDGSPLFTSSVTHSFIKIVRRAGLNGIRFHHLRHTRASPMLHQGVHPKIVQERLGHATIGITLDTYSHLTPGFQEATASLFEDGLSQQVPTTSAR
jgi:integrase